MQSHSLVHCVLGERPDRVQNCGDQNCQPCPRQAPPERIQQTVAVSPLLCCPPSDVLRKSLCPYCCNSASGLSICRFNRSYPEFFKRPTWASSCYICARPDLMTSYFAIARSHVSATLPLTGPSDGVIHRLGIIKSGERGVSARSSFLRVEDLIPACLMQRSPAFACS